MMDKKDSALTHSAYRMLVVTLVLHALAAYAIGPVPFPWLAQLMAMWMFLWVGFKSGLRIAPGMILFSFFFIYALLVTSYQTIIGEYYRFMPPKATTPYLMYIALRFMTMASFGSLVFVTFWFLVRGWKPQIINLMTNLCLFISLAALYIYIAQIYGLPEPPRTRLGTGGGEQSIKFTYAFHRALGTFREPSHLAEWLVLPLFMSFASRGWKSYAARGCGVLALLLSGSLTGIGAILGGMAAGFIFMMPFMSMAVVKTVMRMVIIGAIGVSSFSLFVSSKDSKGTDLVEVLSKRVEPLKEKGIGQSNRNYVYSYLEHTEILWFGTGMGNSNLQFTQATGLDATASFLNLFVNIELSLGYIGLALFIIFLVTPFFILFANRGYQFEPDHFMVLASFFGWLIVFFAHSEELSFHFAIIYALLLHAFLQKKSIPEPALLQ
jgi:hypothetical protein